MAKVMLVEDDNNLREIYSARMQAEGYDVVTASDGEEALVVAKAEKPDLVISDVMMPKISGFEMLDILRNTDGMQAVKVIMLTALGQSDDQARADKLGADRYLVKSQVTLEDIVKAAHDLLGDGTDDAGSGSAPVAAPTPPEPTQPQPAAPAAADTPSAPAPEPVAALTPAASTAPVAEPPVAPAASQTPSAQSTAQEEAAVEAKIEDFVAGATSAAPEPTQAPAAAPATDAAAADDKLVENAAQTLAASVEPAPAPAAPDIKTQSAVQPAPEAPAANQELDAAPAAVPPASTDANSPATRKKVIEPIDTGPKQDINTLYALEQAKETASQPAPPPTAVVATDESGAKAQPLQTPPPATPEQQPPQKPGTDVDPNSIAL